MREHSSSEATDSHITLHHHNHASLTPAISMTARSVISLSTLRRAALWRKVMALRRSPSETFTSAAILWIHRRQFFKNTLAECRGMCVAQRLYRRACGGSHLHSVTSFTFEMDFTDIEMETKKEEHKNKAALTCCLSTQT